ncbi:MAG: dihydropteroate synthase [Akkermansia sp.]|nr:dihydropteroate synthase [Akkermansia sp.]
MARIWQMGGSPWELPQQGAIMGILNVTPDSFSDGGTHAEPAAALVHAMALAEQGADVIDVGGESTRPGAQEVPPAEEAARVLPVLRAIRRELPRIRLSIDTRHAEVARAALDAGADIVNDITGLRAHGMLELCAQNDCGIVLMHMQGNPATMQDNPRYADVVAQVRAFFEERVQAAEQAGIDPQRICLDPGFGLSFGKTAAHNMALLEHLEELRVRNLPLMSALSRKRFLKDYFGNRFDPQSTVAASLLAAARGADIHRVHDVQALRRALHCS